MHTWQAMSKRWLWCWFCRQSQIRSQAALFSRRSSLSITSSIEPIQLNVKNLGKSFDGFIQINLPGWPLKTSITSKGCNSKRWFLRWAYFLQTIFIHIQEGNAPGLICKFGASSTVEFSGYNVQCHSARHQRCWGSWYRRWICDDSLMGKYLV